METRSVTKTIRQLGLKVKGKKTKRYSSYNGEISPAPENLVQRNFHADRPNEKWLTEHT